MVRANCVIEQALGKPFIWADKLAGRADKLMFREPKFTCRANKLIYRDREFSCRANKLIYRDPGFSCRANKIICRISKLFVGLIK